MERVRRKIVKPIAWMGIDPGKSGAACLIVSDGSIIFIDWPKSDNLVEIWISLRRWKSAYNMNAILERVHSRPGQGAPATFSFGQNFGFWKAFLTALSIPYELVTPQKWQKGVGIVPSDGPDPKSRAQAVVTRMYPEEVLFGPRGGYKDGRGDALLIARYLKNRG